MTQSPLVPPFAKEIYLQSKRQANLKKRLFGVRLPEEDQHELRYKLGDKHLLMRQKNPYTEALKR